jgi:hypothetical protein
MTGQVVGLSTGGRGARLPVEAGGLPEKLDRLLRDVLGQYFGASGATVNCMLAGPLLVVTVRGLLTTTEMGLMTSKAYGPTMRRYFEGILRSSEALLSRRLSSLMRLAVRHIQFALAPEKNHVDIVVHFARTLRSRN